MNDVLAEVKKEQERLRRQRAAIDARLAELDTVLRVLPTLGGVQHTLAVIEAVEARDGVSATVMTIKDRIIERVEKLLRQGKPHHTRELVAFLRSEGVELKGKDPVLQVSAVLSRDKRFKADRSIGWTLVVQKDEGPGASTPEPSDSRQVPLASAVATQPQP
jgi:hypothetical protein